MRRSSADVPIASVGTVVCLEVLVAPLRRAALALLIAAPHASALLSHASQVAIVARPTHAAQMPRVHAARRRLIALALTASAPQIHANLEVTAARITHAAPIKRTAALQSEDSSASLAK